MRTIYILLAKKFWQFRSYGDLYIRERSFEIVSSKRATMEPSRSTGHILMFPFSCPISLNVSRTRHKFQSKDPRHPLHPPRKEERIQWNFSSFCFFYPKSITISDFLSLMEIFLRLFGCLTSLPPRPGRPNERTLCNNFHANRGMLGREEPSGDSIQFTSLL